MKTLFTLLFLLVASIAQAQTYTVTWVQNSVASATQAQGFQYKLYITPAGAPTANPPITMQSVLCGGQAPSVQCSIALPTNANAAVVAGAKSELTATDTTSAQESPKSPPFFMGAVAPTTLKITQTGT
jgi:hypothetical protein